MPETLCSEDGELEDGEVHEDGLAEAEESGEASGCEAARDEIENGISVAEHHGPQDQQTSSKAALPVPPLPLPPPLHPQPSGLPLAPTRSGRLPDPHINSCGAAGSGGGAQSSAKVQAHSGQHERSGSGTGRGRSRTSEGHAPVQPPQPGDQSLLPLLLPKPSASGAAASPAAADKDGNQEAFHEDRETEELLELLRELTRGSSFQDVMRSLETVCRDLKQAIKKLDKLFRRVKRRKGDSIEDHPACFHFSRRILEGLHTVNKFSQTSAFLAAPAAGADAARALFKAAMNYRHDVLNVTLKAELEALVRSSKAFKCVLDNRRGGNNMTAATTTGTAKITAAAVGTAMTITDGQPSVLAGNAQAEAFAGGEELPPLPPLYGDPAEAAAEHMETRTDGGTGAPPPPPHSTWSASPSPALGASGVPGPPPQQHSHPKQQHWAAAAAPAPAAAGPGPGGGSSGGKSALQGRAGSSLVGGSGGGMGGGFKLKIVVASTPGDLRAAAAAATASGDAVVGGALAAEGNGGGRLGIDEPPAKRSRSAVDGEGSSGRWGSVVPRKQHESGTGPCMNRVEGEGQEQAPSVRDQGGLRAPSVSRWSADPAAGASDGVALLAPPESPVSDAGGADEAWEAQRQQTASRQQHPRGADGTALQDQECAGSAAYRDRGRSARDKDKEKERERDRERDRDKDKERERDRHRSSKDKEREHGSSHRSSRNRDRDRDASAPHVKVEAADGGDGGAAPSASGQRAGGGPIGVSGSGLSDDQAAVVSSCMGRGRLVLVVDLDGVLADSCWDAQLDGSTAAALVRRAAVEAAALSEERRELFRLPLDGGALWLKLRPGAHAFLARASERYELWARTRQGRPYADAVVELLDPHQQLFGSRVVAAGVLAKRLLAALDCRGPIAVVLDTPDAAWMGEVLGGSLLALPPYAYFGARPCAAGGAMAASGMAGCCMLEVDRDECPERGALAAVLPLLEALHGRVLHAYSSGGGGGGSTTAPASPAAARQQLEAWDVRRVLRELRERLLAGTHITFSRIFTGGATAGPQHPLWQLAEACGAVVSSCCCDDTTHVVSLSSATEKAAWAQQHGRFVVYPSWLECSCYTWHRADEALFLL